MTDLDQAVFKTPLKRKKNDKVSKSKQARKTENEKGSDVDVGNESDVSDSGASSCSQTEWTCLEYDTDEIKKFLKLRGVQVADYFPDTKRFVEKGFND